MNALSHDGCPLVSIVTENPELIAAGAAFARGMLIHVLPPSYETESCPALTEHMPNSLGCPGGDDIDSLAEYWSQMGAPAAKADHDSPCA